MLHGAHPLCMMIWMMFGISGISHIHWKKLIRGNKLPWFTPKIAQAITIRNKLHKKFPKIKSEDNWETYRKRRNIVTSMKRIAQLMENGHFLTNDQSCIFPYTWTPWDGFHGSSKCLSNQAKIWASKSCKSRSSLELNPIKIPWSWLYLSPSFEDLGTCYCVLTYKIN